MSKLSVRQYAELQGVTVQYVYKQIKNGNIEVQEIDNKKYIVMEDKIDYEKKFNELQFKYELLKEKLQVKEEMILYLKEDRKLFTHLIEHKKEVEQHTTKKDKKKKKKKDKK